MSIAREVEELLRPFLAGYGYDLLEVQYRRESGGWVLRLTLDKLEAGPGAAPEGLRTLQGVTLADCEKASKLAETLLDSKELIKDAYSLEVSSPGINRVLRNEADFRKYLGEKVRLTLFAPLNADTRQKNFAGPLLSCQGGQLVIDDVATGRAQIPLSSVAKANLDRI